MTRKTHAIRMLEQAGIPFEVCTYEIPMEDFSAEAVADLLGLPHAKVFKTLVARGERAGPCFAVVPAGRDLDLKALARATGDRRMRLVPVKDIERLTGYRRGGVTVLGASKALPVYLDASAVGQKRIAVSGGAKGIQVRLGCEDYVRATGAAIADLARPR